jgi:hypothetical protein
MYTTPIKHSWKVNLFHKMDTSSGIDTRNISSLPLEVTSFLDRRMSAPDIQARIQWSFEKLFADIQIDPTYLDQIDNPLELAQLSIQSTNKSFASEARKKFLSLTWGDQAYLDEMGKIRKSYVQEKQAFLATSQFQAQTDTILKSQA